MKNKFYTREVKLKAVEMKLAGVPVKKMMTELNIKSESQVYTWYYWHRDGEFHRFDQPIGLMDMVQRQFRIQVIKKE